ncbi:MAG: hypothetical protein ACPLX7_05465 [Candidatus Kapaibacteriota bacterium]|jgi:hypothetical protein
MERFVVSIILFLLYSSIFASEKDTLKEYKLGGVEVVKSRYIPFEKIYQYNPDYQSDIFSKEGLNLIRRGGVLTQDVYFDGFKRNEIAIAIDGELVQCACPNRMDAPITRINIVEMDGIKISKTTSTTNSGLYGKIDFARTSLSKEFKIRSILTGNILARNDYDFQIFGEGLNTGVVLRYSYGSPFKRADGVGFDSLYGYSPAPPNFRYFTASFRHKLDLVEIGAGFSFSKDVLFPYLKMDERKTTFFTGFLSYKENKLYINYTSHLMNNALRKTFSTMEMETDAKNLTIGLTGKYYDVVVRKWDADNYIFSKMMNKKFANSALPGILDISASGNYESDLKFVNAKFRVGIANISISEDSALTIQKNYDPNAKKSRLFIIGALNLFKSFELAKDFNADIMGEFSTVSPTPEQLYITIRRPQQNWIGNSTLKQTTKANLSVGFNFNKMFTIGLSGNYLWNYILPAPDTVQSQLPRVTYKNVNAIIFSGFFKLDLEWLTTELNFFWGENQDTKKPLPEISPLVVTNTVTLPEFWNITISFNHRWENSQKRIVAALNEQPSSAWNTIGLSIAYDYKPFRFVIDVDNLLNHRYARYLSFARDPYSAGVLVFDPGRTISFRILLDKNL